MWQITVDDDGDLTFPSVTVCPTNRVHCSSLIELIQSCRANASAHNCQDGAAHTLCAIGFHAGCLR